MAQQRPRSISGTRLRDTWWALLALLMCPQTLSDPNNGDGQWPGQACVPTETLPEPRTWGWE